MSEIKDFKVGQIVRVNRMSIPEVIEKMKERLPKKHL